MKRGTRHLATRLAVLTLVGGLSSCYYAQALQGGYSVLAARQPIAAILDDPGQDATLKARLSQLLAARDFAVTALRLPDNGSYRSYSVVAQPYVVYNVFAAPPLSLQAVEHCFPVAGCVAYRGYYALAEAKAEAERLRAAGYEVFVGGVTAYSTLGWFDDPVLSTMLRWDDERLAATVFHELAHQVAYARGDTAFNESFAQFVELEGLRQWRVHRGLAEVLPPDLAFDEVVSARVLQTRAALVALYASPVSDAEKAARRDEAFRTLQADYRTLKAQWNAGDAYDNFFSTAFNNAKLLPFGLYHQWVPAFRQLFMQQQQDWVAFYAAVKRLAALSAPARLEALKSLGGE